MFAAAIFDMDGLLIDSEPFWRTAEREAFGAVGIEITEEMATITASMTTMEVASYWYRYRPWQGPTLEDMAQRVVDRVAELIVSKGRRKTGVLSIVRHARSLGWRIGLASNSPASLCHVVLCRLDLKGMFEAVVSADCVERGKPDPQIYQLAAKRLGASPADCIAFEDSASGVQAARNAGMTVVAIPSKGQRFEDPRAAPHLELKCLEDFRVELLMRNA